MSRPVEVCRAWGTLRGCHHDDCKYIHEGRQGDVARARVAAKGSETCKGWSSDTGCRYGADCPYTHSGRGKLYVEKTAKEKSQEECNNWKSTKGCRVGDKCPYKHVGPTGKVDSPPTKSFGRRGGPNTDEDRRVCKHWNSAKGCYRGDVCPYRHVGPPGTRIDSCDDKYRSRRDGRHRSSDRYHYDDSSSDDDRHHNRDRDHRRDRRSLSADERASFRERESGRRRQRASRSRSRSDRHDDHPASSSSLSVTTAATPTQQIPVRIYSATGLNSITFPPPMLVLAGTPFRRPPGQTPFEVPPPMLIRPL